MDDDFDEDFDETTIFEVAAGKHYERKQVADWVWRCRFPDGTFEDHKFRIFEATSRDMQDIAVVLQPYIRRGRIKKTDDAALASFVSMLRLIERIMDPDEYDEFAELMDDEDTRPDDEQAAKMMTAILKKVLPERPLGASSGSARRASSFGRTSTADAPSKVSMPPTYPLTES